MPLNPRLLPVLIWLSMGGCGPVMLVVSGLGPVLRQFQAKSADLSLGLLVAARDSDG